jgi:hypothetical protein
MMKMRINKLIILSAGLYRYKNNLSMSSGERTLPVLETKLSGKYLGVKGMKCDKLK